MANKTLIPALKAKVGTWDYYICMMKYASVAREINFAHELGGNADLNTLIQRGISSRTQDIVAYLKRSEHRFLGALIVAAWGGAPNYSPVQMEAVEENEELLSGLDSQFGVLTFDGTQQYFALDGQHRLKAIKDAIKEQPELGSEEICVLLVSHFDTEEGRRRTRRLFTNINKNAKTTTRAENIALDEDDGFAIISRRLVDEHCFLSKEKRVLVFIRKNDDGEVKLAGESISKTHPKAFTTLSTIYNLIKEMNFGLDRSMTDGKSRPTDETVDLSYDLIAKRIDDLLENCGSIKNELEKVDNVREIRSPKDKEQNGHAFMRPVIQRAVTRVISDIMRGEALSWESIMNKLNQLDWKLSSPPWISVVGIDGNKVKMTTQRDFVKCLDLLLRAHIAPTTKAAIRRARQEYKRLKNEQYPVSEAELAQGMPDES